MCMREYDYMYTCLCVGPGGGIQCIHVYMFVHGPRGWHTMDIYITLVYIRPTKTNSFIHLEESSLEIY